MDLSRVKIMWTNYPNMPTGANATPELYRRLVDFARRHNLVIVNDNPYSFILNERPLSILQVPGAKECCIEFNSMSKSHNMPDGASGMLATNARFVAVDTEGEEQHRLRHLPPHAAGSGTGIPQLRRVARSHEPHPLPQPQAPGGGNHAHPGCTFDPAQVGMFLWGRIPDSYTDVEELTEKVLHEPGSSSPPDSSFGSNGARYIRISLCAKEEILAEALQRIKNII